MFSIKSFNQPLKLTLTIAYLVTTGVSLSLTAGASPREALSVKTQTNTQACQLNELDQIHELARNELVFAIKNSHPEIYANLPDPKSQDKLIQWLQNLDISTLPYICETHSNQLIAIAQAKLRFLKKAALFLAPSYNAHHFAKQVLEALDSDTLICAAYGFHDKWSRQTMWISNAIPYRSYILNNNATVFWAINLPSQQVSFCSNKTDCQDIYIRLRLLQQSGQTIHRDEYTPYVAPWLFHQNKKMDRMDRANYFYSPQPTSSCQFHNMSGTETFYTTDAHYSSEVISFYNHWSCDKVSNPFLYGVPTTIGTNDNFNAHGEETLSFQLQNGYVVSAQYQALEHLEPKLSHKSFQRESYLEYPNTRQFSFDLNCQRSFPIIQMIDLQ